MRLFKMIKIIWTSLLANVNVKFIMIGHVVMSFCDNPMNEILYK